jgi:DNA-binding IclR family transcriptional regulator
VKRRRLLVIVALSVREHGTSPTWGVLQRALGVDRIKLVRLLEALRADGLVTYTGASGSLRVTPAGVREAVGR